MQTAILSDHCFPPQESAGMATQPERIASLETTASIAKWVLGIFIPLVIGWGAFITVNVIAMKQDLADGGNTKLVTELKAPKSPEQLQANLAAVSAQIQVARVNGERPEVRKIAALSRALNQVTQKNPELSQAWQTAAQLVSFKFPDADIPSRPCFTVKTDIPTQQTPPTSSPVVIVASAYGCTMDLDDPRNFVEYVRERRSGTVALYPNVEHTAVQFVNARIIYHGGSLLPDVSNYIFVNCIFDFQIPAPPPAGGKKLTQQLLSAENLNNVRVSGL